METPDRPKFNHEYMLIVAEHEEISAQIKAIVDRIKKVTDDKATVERALEQIQIKTPVRNDDELLVLHDLHSNLGNRLSDVSSKLLKMIFSNS